MNEREWAVNVYNKTARSAYRKYGNYETAHRELARLRNQSSWGTFSYSFGNAVVKALDFLQARGELDSSGDR